MNTPVKIAKLSLSQIDETLRIPSAKDRKNLAKIQICEQLARINGYIHSPQMLGAFLRYDDLELKMQITDFYKNYGCVETYNDLKEFLTDFQTVPVREHIESELAKCNLVQVNLVDLADRLHSEVLGKASLTAIAFLSKDVVPRNRPEFEVYLKLRKIYLLVSSPVIPKNFIEQLRADIKEFYAAYHHCFVRNKLAKIVPKIHNLAHYPSLSSTWDLRFSSIRRGSKVSIRRISRATHLPDNLRTKRFRLSKMTFSARRPALN